MIRRKNALISAVLTVLAVSMISPMLLAAKATGTTKTPTAKHTQKAATKQKGKAGGLKSLLAKLTLTAAQKTKIAAIDKDTLSKVKAVKADKKLTDAQQKTKIKAIHKDSRDKTIKVLTPEQQKKLKKLQKQAAANQKAGTKKPVKNGAKNK
jgi:Spy/CpxP family protein refolding chaperone